MINKIVMEIIVINNMFEAVRRYAALIIILENQFNAPPPSLLASRAKFPGAKVKIQVPIQ